MVVAGQSDKKMKGFGVPWDVKQTPSGDFRFFLDPAVVVASQAIPLWDVEGTLYRSVLRRC